MMKDAIILVADDDKDIVKLISESLEDEGYAVIGAYDGKETLKAIETTKFSLIILDILMPEMDGLEVCRKVRNSVDAPIIFVSAKDREIDKVVGLEVGADDYITKPFSINELIVRVNAHIRREKRKETGNKSSRPLKVGPFTIDKEAYETFKYNQKIDLSSREFQIFLFLVENINRVLTREQIYEAIWKNDYTGDVNIVTTHIKNLRNKIDDKENIFIKTIWGIGYKFTGGQM